MSGGAGAEPLLSPVRRSRSNAFGQDLASLRRHAAARHQLCAIDYRFFRERFQRLLPDSVLGSDLAAYAAPEHATARAAWRRECRAALHELYALFEFDLVILPSDIFPYVRDLIPAAHELGAPVVVVQKETTISPHTLEVHAGNVGASTPFISDHMTVCSERQKQFWLNAGSAPERIDVTGQPRFDFYRDPSQWCGWDELGVKVMPEREVILFLSYSPGAYIPIEDFESGRHWAAEQLGSRLARGRELAAALRGRGGCPERLIGQRPSPWLAGLRHWRRSRV